MSIKGAWCKASPQSQIFVESPTKSVSNAVCNSLFRTIYNTGEDLFPVLAKIITAILSIVRNALKEIEN